MSPLVVFESRGALRPPRPAIVGLPPNPLLPTEINLARARRFQLALSGGGAAPLAINGETSSDWGAEPLFAAPRGAPVTLAIANATEFVPDDEAFRPCRTPAVCARRRLGALLARHVSGGAGRTAHIAFVADNPGKWPLASATPARRAAGLCGWFQVS